MLAQTPVEATPVVTKAAAVIGTGLGRAAERSPEGALSSGNWAEAWFGDLGGDGVLGSLGIVLAAIVLTLRSFAPVSTGGCSSCLTETCLAKTWLSKTWLSKSWLTKSWLAEPWLTKTSLTERSPSLTERSSSLTERSSPLAKRPSTKTTGSGGSPSKSTKVSSCVSSWCCCSISFFLFLLWHGKPNGH